MKDCIRCLHRSACDKADLPNGCENYEDKYGYYKLPCPIGTEVFVIEQCVCGTGYREPSECHKRNTSRSHYIKAVLCSSKYHNVCAKLYVKPFRIEYLNQIGKTVFLTQTEAETALEKKAKK